jgi:hypothetical protein
MFRLILYISQGILMSSKNRSVIHASLLLFICNIFEAAGASVESHLSAMRRACRTEVYPDLCDHYTLNSGKSGKFI